MALTWHIGNIRKYADNVDAAWVKHDRASNIDNGWRLVPELEGLIFWLGVIGFGEITEKNAAEVYGRSKVAELLHEITYIRVFDEQEADYRNEPLTMEMVRDHIGLTTNHNRHSLTEWLNRSLYNSWSNDNLEEKMPKTVARAMVTVEAWKYQSAMSAEVVPA